MSFAETHDLDITPALELPVPAPEKLSASGLHAGPAAHWVQRLSKLTLAAGLPGGLPERVLPLSAPQIRPLLKTLAEAGGDRVVGELKKFGLGLPEVFSALLSLWVSRHEISAGNAVPAEMEKIFRENAALHKNAGVKNVTVRVFDGAELIEGPDSFILSPFFVDRDGNAVFYMSRLLVEALNRMDGRKRTEILGALAERELLLQQYLRGGMDFDAAHRKILDLAPAQKELFEWASALARTPFVDILTAAPDWKIQHDYLMQAAKKLNLYLKLKSESVSLTEKLFAEGGRPRLYLHELLPRFFGGYLSMRSRKLRAPLESHLPINTEKERTHLARELEKGLGRTSGISAFFEGSSQWNFDAYLDRVIAEKVSKNDLTLTVKSVGSARGEEPYSIALMILEKLEDYHKNNAAQLGVSLNKWLARWRVDIQAYDINISNLYATQLGVFDSEQMASLPDRYRRYFRQEGENFHADDRLRSWIRPQYLDLNDAEQTAHLGRSPADGVFCLRTLLQVPPENRGRIVDDLTAALKPQGHSTYFALTVGVYEESLPYFHFIRDAEGTIVSSPLHKQQAARRDEILSTSKDPAVLERFRLVERAAKLLAEGTDAGRRISPDAILPVDAKDVPAAIITYFENQRRSEALMDGHVPSTVEMYFVLTHPNGDKTYFSQQANRNTEGGPVTERLTRLADWRQDKMIGWGIVRNNLTGNREEPHVGYTHTEENLREEGLGIRRIRSMNAISQKLYALPLASDTTRTSAAEGVWEKLVRRGEARVLDAGTHKKRYVYSVSLPAPKAEPAKTAASFADEINKLSVYPVTISSQEDRQRTLNAISELLEEIDRPIVFMFDIDQTLMEKNGRPLVRNFKELLRVLRRRNHLVGVVTHRAAVIEKLSGDTDGDAARDITQSAEYAELEQQLAGLGVRIDDLDYLAMGGVVLDENRYIGYVRTQNRFDKNRPGPAQRIYPVDAPWKTSKLFALSHADDLLADRLGRDNFDGADLVTIGDDLEKDHSTVHMQPHIPKHADRVADFLTQMKGSAVMQKTLAHLRKFTGIIPPNVSVHSKKIGFTNAAGVKDFSLPDDAVEKDAAFFAMEETILRQLRTLQASKESERVLPLLPVPLSAEPKTPQTAEEFLAQRHGAPRHDGLLARIRSVSEWNVLGETGEFMTVLEHPDVDFILKVPNAATLQNEVQADRILENYELGVERLGGLIPFTAILRNVTLRTEGKPAETYPYVIVQKKIRPLQTVVFEPDQHRRTVREFVSLTHRLWERGVFDKDMGNVMENYGYDDAGNLVLFDLSHLTDAPDALPVYIENWKSLAPPFYRAFQFDEVEPHWRRGLDATRRADIPAEEPGLLSLPKALLPFWPQRWVQRHPNRLATIETFLFQGLLVGGVSLVLHAWLGWDLKPLLAATGLFSSLLFTVLHYAVYFDAQAPPVRLGWNPFRHFGVRVKLLALALVLGSAVGIGILVSPVWGGLLGLGTAVLIHLSYLKLPGIVSFLRRLSAEPLHDILSPQKTGWARTLSYISHPASAGLFEAVGLVGVVAVLNPVTPLSWMFVYVGFFFAHPRNMRIFIDSWKKRKLDKEDALTVAAEAFAEALWAATFFRFTSHWITVVAVLYWLSYPQTLKTLYALSKRRIGPRELLYRGIQLIGIFVWIAPYFTPWSLLTGGLISGAFLLFWDLILSPRLGLPILAAIGDDPDKGLLNRWRARQTPRVSPAGARKPDLRSAKRRDVLRYFVGLGMAGAVELLNPQQLFGKVAQPAGMTAKHRILPGEKLSSIAELYGVDEETVRQANRLPGKAALKPGTFLKIPGVSELPAPDDMRALLEGFNVVPTQQAIRLWNAAADIPSKTSAVARAMGWTTVACKSSAYNPWIIYEVKWQIDHAVETGLSPEKLARLKKFYEQVKTNASEVSIQKMTRDLDKPQMPVSAHRGDVWEPLLIVREENGKVVGWDINRFGHVAVNPRKIPIGSLILIEIDGKYTPDGKTIVIPAKAYDTGGHFLSGRLDIDVGYVRARKDTNPKSGTWNRPDIADVVRETPQLAANDLVLPVDGLQIFLPFGAFSFITIGYHQGETLRWYAKKDAIKVHVVKRPLGLFPFWPRAWVQKYPKTLATVETVILGGLVGGVSLLLNHFLGWDLKWVLSGIGLLFALVFSLMHPAVYYDILAPPRSLADMTPGERWRARGALFALGLTMNAAVAAGVLLGPVLGGLLGLAAAGLLHLGYNLRFAPRWSLPLAIFGRKTVSPDRPKEATPPATISTVETARLLAELLNGIEPDQLIEWAAADARTGRDFDRLAKDIAVRVFEKGPRGVSLGQVLAALAVLHAREGRPIGHVAAALDGNEKDAGLFFALLTDKKPEESAHFLRFLGKTAEVLPPQDRPALEKLMEEFISAQLKKSGDMLLDFVRQTLDEALAAQRQTGEPAVVAFLFTGAEPLYRVAQAIKSSDPKYVSLSLKPLYLTKKIINGHEKPEVFRYLQAQGLFDCRTLILADTGFLGSIPRYVHRLVRENGLRAPPEIKGRMLCYNTDEEDNRHLAQDQRAGFDIQGYNTRSRKFPRRTELENFVWFLDMALAHTHNSPEKIAKDRPVLSEMPLPVLRNLGNRLLAQFLGSQRSPLDPEVVYEPPTFLTDPGRLLIDGEKARWLASGMENNIFQHPTQPWVVRVRRLSGADDVKLEAANFALLAKKGLAPAPIARGVTNGHGYLVVEKIEGLSLDRIRRTSPSALEPGLSATRQLLTELLRARLFLQDWKPENVMFGHRPGEPSRALVVDARYLEKTPQLPIRELALRYRQALYGFDGWKTCDPQKKLLAFLNDVIEGHTILEGEEEIFRRGAVAHDISSKTTPVPNEPSVVLVGADNSRDFDAEALTRLESARRNSAEAFSEKLLAEQLARLEKNLSKVNGFSFRWAQAIAERLRAEHSINVDLAPTHFTLASVIQELIKNAFVHGNRLDLSRSVRINWAVENGQLSVTVTDHGTAPVEFTTPPRALDAEFEARLKIASVAGTGEITSNHLGAKLMRKNGYDLRAMPFENAEGRQIGNSVVATIPLTQLSGPVEDPVLARWQARRSQETSSRSESSGKSIIDATPHGLFPFWPRTWVRKYPKTLATVETVILGGLVGGLSALLTHYTGWDLKWVLSGVGAATALFFALLHGAVYYDIHAPPRSLADMTPSERWRARGTLFGLGLAMNAAMAAGLLMGPVVGPLLGLAAAILLHIGYNQWLAPRAGLPLGTIGGESWRDDYEAPLSRSFEWFINQAKELVLPAKTREKFHETGKAKDFPGLSAVLTFKKGSPTHDRVRTLMGQLKGDLERAGVSHYFAFLDAADYEPHMTLYDTALRPDRPLTDELTRKVKDAFTGLAQENLVPAEWSAAGCAISAGEGGASIVLRTHPKQKQDLDTALRVRDRLHAALRSPDRGVGTDVPFIGHTTLAYIVKDIPPADYRKVQDILRRYVFQSAGNFLFDRVEFRKFNTMLDWDDPLAELTLQPGSAVPQKPKKKWLIHDTGAAPIAEIAGFLSVTGYPQLIARELTEAMNRRLAEGKKVALLSPEVGRLLMEYGLWTGDAAMNFFGRFEKADKAVIFTALKKADIPVLKRYFQKDHPPKPDLSRSIFEVLAKILARRKNDTVEKVARFLNADGRQKESDYNDLPHMREAVKLIKDAVKKQEKIVIFGDYDVDGVTATAIMLKTLHRILKAEGIPPEDYGKYLGYHIPNRFTEGYGMSVAGVDEVIAEGAKLLITVDNGIRCRKPVERALELGIRVIVTDHHQPDKENADTPVNVPLIHAMYIEERDHPAKHISGAGVAYKLAQALMDDYGIQRPADDLLDLFAFGAVADLVPLRGDNRLLVTRGLELINSPRVSLGIRKLLEVARKNGKIKEDQLVETGTIGYYLAPMINASGRIASATEALDLLMTEDAAMADEYAGRLYELNMERREIEAQMVELVETRLKKEFDSQTKGAIVVGEEGWNEGVIGILASRIVETWGLPAAVFSIDREKGIAKGSMRTIPGVSVIDALTECQKQGLVLKGGGHEAAGGCSVALDKFEEFKRAYSDAVRRQMETKNIEPFIELDALLATEDMGIPLIQLLEKLAPFGVGNARPVFAGRGLRVTSYKISKDGKHVRGIRLDSPNRSLEAVAWRMATPEILQLLNDSVRTGKKLDLIFTLETSDFGGVHPQLVLRDIRPASETSPAETARLAKAVVAGGPLRPVTPPRERLEKILTRAGNGDLPSDDIDDILQAWEGLRVYKYKTLEKESVDFFIRLLERLKKLPDVQREEILDRLHPLFETMLDDQSEDWRQSFLNLRSPKDQPRPLWAQPLDFNALFDDTDVLLFGDTHTMISQRAFLAQRMRELKEAGVTHFVYEGVGRQVNNRVREDRRVTLIKGDNIATQMLRRAAEEAGIQFVPIDMSAQLMDSILRKLSSFASARLGRSYDFETLKQYLTTDTVYDELVMRRRNIYFSNFIKTILRNNPNAKIAGIMGETHLTSKRVRGGATGVVERLRSAGIHAKGVRLENAESAEAPLFDGTRWDAPGRGSTVYIPRDMTYWGRYILDTFLTPPATPPEKTPARKDGGSLADRISRASWRRVSEPSLVGHEVEVFVSDELGLVVKVPRPKNKKKWNTVVKPHAQTAIERLGPEAANAAPLAPPTVLLKNIQLTVDGQTLRFDEGIAQARVPLLGEVMHELDKTGDLAGTTALLNQLIGLLTDLARRGLIYNDEFVLKNFGVWRGKDGRLSVVVIDFGALTPGQGLLDKDPDLIYFYPAYVDSLKDNLKGWHTPYGKFRYAEKLIACLDAEKYFLTLNHLLGELGGLAKPLAPPTPSSPQKAARPFDVSHNATAWLAGAVALSLGLLLTVFGAAFVAHTADPAAFWVSLLVLGWGQLFTWNGQAYLRRYYADWKKANSFRAGTTTRPAPSEETTPIDEELWQSYVAGLKKMNPDFRAEDLRVDWDGQKTRGSRLASTDEDGNVWLDPWLVTDVRQWVTAQNRTALEQSDVRLLLLQKELLPLIVQHEGLRVRYTQHPLLQIPLLQTLWIYLTKPAPEPIDVAAASAKKEPTRLERVLQDIRLFRKNFTRLESLLAADTQGDPLHIHGHVANGLALLSSLDGEPVTRPVEEWEDLRDRLARTLNDIERRVGASMFPRSGRPESELQQKLEWLKNDAGITSETTAESRRTYERYLSNRQSDPLQLGITGGLYGGNTRLLLARRLGLEPYRIPVTTVVRGGEQPETLLTAAVAGRLDAHRRESQITDADRAARLGALVSRLLRNLVESGYMSAADSRDFVTAEKSESWRRSLAADNLDPVKHAVFIEGALWQRLYGAVRDRAPGVSLSSDELTAALDTAMMRLTAKDEKKAATTAAKPVLPTTPEKPAAPSERTVETPSFDLRSGGFPALLHGLGVWTRLARATRLVYAGLTLGVSPVQLARAESMAYALAETAAKAMLTAKTGIKTEQKADGTLVTEMDKRIQDLAAAEIRRRFPRHTIFAEEGAAQRTVSEWMWTIDPINGTKAYAEGGTEYTFDMSLLHNGRPVLAVSFAPEMTAAGQPGVRAIGSRWTGTLLNGKPVRFDRSQDGKRDWDVISRSSVSRKKDDAYLRTWRDLYGESHVRQVSNGALAGLQILTEQNDAVFSNVVAEPWDPVAISALLEWAGGAPLRYDGASYFPLTPADFDRAGQGSSGYILTRGGIHGKRAAEAASLSNGLPEPANTPIDIGVDIQLAVPPVQRPLSEIKDSDVLVARLLPLAGDSSASSSSPSLLEALTLSSEKTAAGTGNRLPLERLSPEAARRLLPYMTDAERRAYGATLRREAKNIRDSLSAGRADEGAFRELLRNVGRVHGQGGVLFMPANAADIPRQKRREMGHLVRLAYESGLIPAGAVDGVAAQKLQGYMDVYNRARHTAEMRTNRSAVDRLRESASSLLRKLRELVLGDASLRVFHIPVSRDAAGKLLLLDDARTGLWLDRLSRTLSTEGQKVRTVLVTNESLSSNEKGELWDLVVAALARRTASAAEAAQIAARLKASLATDRPILFREDVGDETRPGIIQARSLSKYLKGVPAGAAMDIYTLWEDQWDLSGLRKEAVRLLVLFSGDILFNAAESLEKSIATIRYIQIQA
ncbi:MAG TPA: single-stranded-DNA-specific exonuclease RecJ [Elusimicrobiota bacterium]|nr:single-stranded-DNA-specific exonuclease RecJ [Elusimicrobiota bacterium]